MLRAVLDKKLKRWENCLPHVEFAVYGYIPRVLIDLFLLDAVDAPHIDTIAHVEQMINLREQTQWNIVLLMLSIKMLVVKV
jgi:hypothetical protein